MAKVRCGWVMCEHNSKHTPQGYGTCKCKEKVYLKFKDEKDGRMICKQYHMQPDKMETEGGDFSNG